MAAVRHGAEQEMTNGPGRRLRLALRAARDSVSRPVRHVDARPWTGSMTVAALAAFCLSVLVAVSIDQQAILWVREARGDTAWLRALAAITDLGQSQWYLVPAALFFVAAGLADWSRHGPRGRARLSYVFGQAAFAFAAVALSGILVNVAKFLIGRPRPRLMDERGPFGFEPFNVDSAFLSYPSGHSTTVGAVALVLMLWFPRLRPAIAVVAVVLGFSRVAALAHYPADVVAGLAFGFLYSLFLARWLGARGAAFRLTSSRLLPDPRHPGAWRFRSGNR